VEATSAAPKPLGSTLGLILQAASTASLPLLSTKNPCCQLARIIALLSIALLRMRLMVNLMKFTILTMAMFAFSRQSQVARLQTLTITTDFVHVEKRYGF
jgi:hypothetical protein